MSRIHWLAVENGFQYLTPDSFLSLLYHLRVFPGSSEHPFHRSSQLDTRRLSSLYSLPVECPLNFIQALAFGLDHEEEAHHCGQGTAAAKEKVDCEATLVEQDWANKCHKPVADPVESMSKCRRFRTRVLRLDFRGVNFDTDGPGCGEEDRVEVDANDHNPASGASAGSATGVESAN